VTIQGTSISTETDFDGNYCLTAKRGDILVFAMAGISVKKEVKNNILDAVIGIEELDEVVIVSAVALGVKSKRRDVGYSSQMLKSEGLSSALRGKVAGVAVEGGKTFITLRGNSSLQNNKDALIVIDGRIVDASALNSLKPDDIASTTILKGAGGAILYGSKGANGVIVITTKKSGLMTTTAISPEEQALLLKIKARKNFKETAFFLPTLRTNKKGEIRFSFTMPEALTTWKLQLLAHTKDLKVGTKTLTTVTQKDLMVIPNVPRFLREGDSIVISSKISNLTPEKGTGFAQLVLTNALDGASIDKALGNTNATKNFTVDAKGNTAVSWKLYIPKGTEAVQWKVVAKMGNYTDGEQNALPVLTNRMLVTESMAMWVRQGQTKTFTLDKLKNNSSKTLSNHKLTLEITSNPAWYAVQSLPYLMEYPHECAEQTFSRYYANALATHIANSNPKIQEVFKQWENTDALLSNLEKNQDLKNIIIQETPWLRQAQSESEQKKRIGLLFNLDKMSRELKRTANKLSRMQHGNGGFPWFKGSRYESPYITRHVASGFGHLKKLGVASFSPKTTKMLRKAVNYLDKETIANYQKLLDYSHEIVFKAKKKDKAQAKLDSVAYLAKNHLGNTQMHYLYMRSFYKDIATTKALDKAINYYTQQTVAYWQEKQDGYWGDKSSYSRGLMALYLHRGTHQALAKEIVKSLDENSITDDEMGMYWKNNRAGYYWDQAPIETQALMIEVFSEIDKDELKINNLKLWLLKNKQTTQWKTTKATTEAIYALLLQGSDWLSVDEVVNVKIGNQTIDPSKMPDVKAEAGTGYFKTSWNSDEIKPEMAVVKLSKKEAGVAWGALYWQYFEDLDKITLATGGKQTPLFLSKKVFLKKNTDTGEALALIDENTTLKVGDLVRIRIELRADRKMEFIHMKDMRAAGLEPVNVISKYKWQDGLGYYESTKDASTNFFISNLPKGIYVFEYDLRVNNAGNFSNGITTIQSMYAPEFSSHSKGIRLEVEP
jgi:TonB-dependent SusC/RagA subfamily outer membrane receptor